MILPRTSWSPWTDAAEHRGWRMESSGIGKEYDQRIFRLIQPSGQRVMVGSRSEVEGRWRQESEYDPIRDRDKPVIVLIHGLGRTRRSMGHLRKLLQRAFPEIDLLCFGYASMRDEIGEHARNLDRYLSLSIGSRPVIFIAHSLGNIVLRRFYKLREEAGNGSKDPLNLRAHVMLGPPNQGSLFAKKMSRVPGVSQVMGPSFMQLGARWEDIRENLSVPSGETVIFAGDVPFFRKGNLLLPEPNDGLVTVQETTLPGVTDLEVLPVLHSFLMNDRAIVDRLQSRIAEWCRR